MTPAKVEPVIPASEQPKTLALDHSATGMSHAKFGINVGHKPTRPFCIKCTCTLLTWLKRETEVTQNSQ